MQTIAALGALRQSGLDPRNCVLGISEPTKAGRCWRSISCPSWSTTPASAGAIRR
jgi:hypothetical protein